MAESQAFTCITGYEPIERCEHCNRRMVHGVRTASHGTIGADCFVKLIKADRKRFGGNGKPSASMVRDFAKMREFRSDERLALMGYYPRHFVFELA